MRHLFAILFWAATVDPTFFQDLHWRLIGPFRAGRVLAVSGVPGEPEHFYFGSVNGGVWETRDAGRTWQPIFDSQPIGSIGALAVASSNPNVIYVGSGEADMRSDISQGNGMYKSTDGGKTWTHIGLEDSQQIGKILIHPTNPDLVYVAALGHPYAANAERGVYRSSDGGRSWQKILGPDNATGAIDLDFEPGNPKVIYAALWQTRRTPWSVYPPSNGPGSGLFKSTDGGDHWNAIQGLPAKVGRIGIAVAPSMPQRVYAVVDATDGGGMYRSDDGGATWARTSSDSRVWSRGWYFGGITVEPKNADVVYSCNVNVYRSEDAGKTFIPVKGAPGGDDYHALWIDPDHPERRILGVDQGTVVSVNGGKTWSSWYNQPTGQFYHVSTDNRFPYWVYGSQQDSGAAGVPSRTNNIDGINITNFRESTAGGESDNLAPDPKDPNIIYGGRVDKLDVRTMQTQSIDPTLAYPGNDRATWTLPLVFSPRDPRVLYFSNQRLFRTEDGGQHWTLISPDLTREDPGTPANLDPITAADRARPGPRQGVIYAIAPSRTSDHDIWVGTDDGQIWRTRDEGAHWQNITPPPVTSWSKVGPPRRFSSVRLPHARRRKELAVDHRRSADLRQRCSRRSGAQRFALRRNGARSLRFVRRWRSLAIAADESSRDLGARYRRARQRSGDRHARPRVLGHGRRFFAPPDWQFDSVSFQTGDRLSRTSRRLHGNADAEGRSARAESAIRCLHRLCASPHPVPLPAERGEGGRRPGEGRHARNLRFQRQPRPPLRQRGQTHRPRPHADANRAGVVRRALASRDDAGHAPLRVADSLSRSDGRGDAAGRWGGGVGAAGKCARSSHQSAGVGVRRAIRTGEADRADARRDRGRDGGSERADQGET
ncbi:MAG: hypothetical protein DMF59_12385 [Acidobacteria bacterium]|nr:MAG: hypothetical protein DMF59_12385 [Acidobacteriota bacterium]